MTTIDVSDIDLYLLIRELWRCREPAAFFSLSGVTSPAEPTDEDIRRALSNPMNPNDIDYLCGRGIKTNFSDLKNVDMKWYDRDAGEGAFKRAVDRIRNS